MYFTWHIVARYFFELLILYLFLNIQNKITEFYLPVRGLILLARNISAIFMMNDSQINIQYTQVVYKDPLFNALTVKLYPALLYIVVVWCSGEFIHHIDWIKRSSCPTYQRDGLVRRCHKAASFEQAQSNRNLHSLSERNIQQYLPGHVTCELSWIPQQSHDLWTAASGVRQFRNQNFQIPFSDYVS